MRRPLVRIKVKSAAGGGCSCSFSAAMATGDQRRRHCLLPMPAPPVVQRRECDAMLGAVRASAHSTAFKVLQDFADLVLASHPNIVNPAIRGLKMGCSDAYSATAGLNFRSTSKARNNPTATLKASVKFFVLRYRLTLPTFTYVNGTEFRKATCRSMPASLPTHRI